jgi:hypothetical protein
MPGAMVLWRDTTKIMAWHTPEPVTIAKQFHADFAAQSRFQAFAHA